MDINNLYNEFKSSAGISTDTRNISQDQIFFALRGPNFNANRLAEEALRKGAKLAVIDDPEYSSLQDTILVEDSLAALQALASYHRKQLNIPVIGLTGSNGKTTTKELIKSVLEKKYKVWATKGNLNNHIGVPLTILSISDHEIAIIEMGANHVGEIAALCEIAQPSHGLITNIGKAHIGEFGGFENIIRGKSELFDYLLKNKGQVFINTEDVVLKNMAKRFQNASFYPSAEHCNIKFTGADPFVTFTVDGGNDTTTKIIGAYNFPNIAAAICIGRFFNVGSNIAVSAIKEYTPSSNRSQIISAGSNTIILDAYNANPSSMEAAVINFGKMKAANKIVILGDMLELGEDTVDEHRKLGALVKEQNFSRSYFVGPLMKDASKAFPEAEYFERKDDLAKHLQDHQLAASTILVKGSRGMGLETLTELF